MILLYIVVPRLRGEGIEGMLNTAWDDCSPHMETYWRGFIASAEYSWVPAEKQVKPGKTDFTNVFIELPDVKAPGTWSKKYAVRLKETASIVEKYKETSKQLLGLYKNSKRNRYHWELFSALNDFQLTAPQLLLALQQGDTADPQKQKAGIGKVSLALDEFKKAWENLKAVYSKTRFIAYSENYVPDHYLQFASQREDLTWMVQQAEELLHPEIRQWMDNVKTTSYEK